jgi:hypothetical protein
MPWIRTLLLLAAIPAPAAAQAAPLSSDTTLADTTFRDSTQFVSVHLRKHVIYQIHVDGVVQPTLRPADSRQYPPTLIRIRDTGGLLGGPVYEVHVERDAEYRLGAVTRGSTVHLRMVADAASTRIVEERESRPSWGIGLHVGVGRHSGYQLSSPGVNPSGLHYEAGVLISQGTTFALILGGGGDKRGGGDFNVDWVFAELRGRLVSLRTLGGPRALDVGLLARYAQGNSGQTSTHDPKLFAGGVYLQQHLTMNSRGRGFSISGSFYYGGLSNLTIDQNASTLMAALQWLP